MGRSNKLFLLMPSQRRNTLKYAGPTRTPQDDKWVDWVVPTCTFLSFDHKCALIFPMLRIFTTEEAANYSISPKHIAIPYLAVESELLFEVLVLLLFSICTLSQYINIYRTVWWLPQSHIDTMLVSKISFSFILCYYKFHGRFLKRFRRVLL